MIKESIMHRYTRIFNVHTPNKSVKICGANNRELQGEMDKSTIGVEDFNTPHQELRDPADTKSVRT